jgi:hypothetical protein
MRRLAGDLADEYERIQQRAVEDPGTAGDQGEENWATLLRRWLPPGYRVVTKGRLLSAEGVASPQVDVVVLLPTYPEALLDKKLYLIAGVAAAFECKVTLKPQHLTAAAETAAVIHQMLPRRTGTPFRELHDPLVYGLLAHSHVWKNEGSTPLENASNQLTSATMAAVQHPRELLDLVCVADLATWCAVRSYDAVPGGEEGGLQRAPSAGFRRHALGVDQGQTFSVLGPALSYLLRRLAWDEPALRPLAVYFRAADVEGRATRVDQPWPNSVFSPRLRNYRGAPFRSREPWDEWQPTEW